MPRLKAFLQECLGPALCEKGRQALLGHWTYPEVLQEVVKVAFERSHKVLPGAALRAALQDAAASSPASFEARLGPAVDSLALAYPLTGYRDNLLDYLRALPSAVRSVLRRPSDPTGRTAPENMVIYLPENLLTFLPARKPRFRPGARPPGLDNWTLKELWGLGECSEVWVGEDPAQADHSPAALKFAIDPETRTRVTGGTALFQKVFGLNELTGCLPLRSVYLQTDPPCLEAPLVPGYDLAGLMFDWRWKYESSKPEAALKLVRRLTAIVAKAHEKGVVHRDLKPSNVILRPTDSGKFVMWVTDFGWGQLEAPRLLEVAKGGPKGEQERLAHRGAGTHLYAAPQVIAGQPPAPGDDVYAIGVIWYQLLRRDPTAQVPAGAEWVEEFRPAGLTDTQAKVLRACVSARWEDRPRNAMLLADQLAKVTVASAKPDESKLLRLEGLSGMHPMPAGLGGAVGASTAHLPKLVTNSVGMPFVRVKAGSFRMGAPDGEAGRRPAEGPVHDVRLTRAFYLGVTPVTQGQYARVTDQNPSKFRPGPGGGGPDHPVESVSWDDAVRFCEVLNRTPAEVEAGRSYRLPTEAEWEFACRAGTDTPFSFGAKMTGKEGVCMSAAGGRYGGKSTAPVGQSPANPWGLHDMHGNVQEWCADWFHEAYYAHSPVIDPAGPSEGDERVVRGGSWSSFPTDCRAAARRSHAPNKSSETIGFRVVLEQA